MQQTRRRRPSASRQGPMRKNRPTDGAPDNAYPTPRAPAPEAPGPVGGDDAQTTWNPAQHDPFGEDEFWDLDAGAKTPGFRAAARTPSPAAPARPAERKTAAAPDRPTGPLAADYDPDETVVTSGEIAEVWGDEFDADATPRTTLKTPGQARSSSPARKGSAFRPAAKMELDGYELLEVLGEGGVGIVYQALQKSILRRIALKMIKPEFGRDTQEQEKFISEAMVTGSLDHPNIVPIHDLGRTRDGQPFYAMKMVRGTPWTQHLRQNSLAEHLRVLLYVCDAVSFAHSKGVIHRDLKPDNVMLGEFGEVQLMDWGLGVVIEKGGHALPLPASLAVGGTPAYMAPEMVTGRNGPVGYHSDVYLLGAILYELVTGRPPHGGFRIMDTLENALQNRIEPTEQGGVLVEIALRAMRTDPAERYPSVKAFKQALLDYQANAESIRLAERAAVHVERGRREQDYTAFAEALFAYRQALGLWSGNEAARVGLRDTQWHYAHCAFEKGDYDLAASMLDPACAAHVQLAAQIAAAAGRRAQGRRRMRTLRYTAMGLTSAIIVILTVASIWIYAAKRREEHAKNIAVAAQQRAVLAKETAVAAQQAEAEQRRVAETAMLRAKDEETRAVQALADLKKAVNAMVAAQDAEERALAQARASELAAEETRDQLARTGMLMDNSWWTFDAAEARRRQAAAARSAATPAELDIRLAGDTSLSLVLIPGGEFVMGSPPKEERRSADEYLHRVHLTRPYYLSRTELTQGQWQAITGQPPPGAEENEVDPQRPLTGVSYEQIAGELLPALQKYTPPGWRFRLPTESEWEYACRAGMPTAYHGGDGEAALDAAGWFLFNSERRVQPVAGKSPNAFGLYDMHGNVGEVCADEYSTSAYLETATEDPHGEWAVERPIVRGGSVFNTPQHCRAAYRSYAYSKNKYEFLGVRLALVREN